MIVGLETISHCSAPKIAAATMLTTTPRLALPYKSRSCAARSCGLLESRLTRASDAVGRMAHNPITGVITYPTINVVTLDLKPAGHDWYTPVIRPGRDICIRLGTY